MAQHRRTGHENIGSKTSGHATAVDRTHQGAESQWDESQRKMQGTWYWRRSILLLSKTGAPNPARQRILAGRYPFHLVLLTLKQETRVVKPFG